MAGFQLSRPFYLKIGLTGTALVVLGVIFPWQGAQFLPGTFMENFPVTAWGLITLSVIIAMLFLRQRPYHILGAAVVMVAWGLPMFSYFYFGRYNIAVWSDNYSPHLIPGLALFEVGLMCLGGGALGLIYLQRQALETLRGAPPPIPGEDALGIRGTWQLAGIGQDNSVFPAGVITRFVNQTWEFGADGQLTIKTLGFRKIFSYTVNEREITARDPRNDKTWRLEITLCDRVETVLRSLDPPKVEFRLVRPG